MSIVQEIIHEAKQETRIKLKRNGKRLITTLFIISSLMSVIFYILGIPYQDSVYRQIPLFAGIPMLAMASFNAFGMTSIAMFFLWSLGEVTNSTIKNGLEQRREKLIERQAEAINDKLTKYGQRDSSLQIDEVKQGLQYQIDEIIMVLRRELRIKNLAVSKQRNLRIQAEHERDKAIQERDESKRKQRKLGLQVNFLLSTIFRLEQIIKKLKGE